MGHECTQTVRAARAVDTCLCGWQVAAPVWLVKVRTQASTQHKQPFQWPATATGYWVGSTPLVVRGALLTAGQMGGYDGAKKACAQRRLLSDGPVLHVFAATVAGFSAATLSAPADVLQTRMQSEGSSIRAAAAAVMRSAGARGFFRGWSANVLRLIPTFVVGSTIYEQCRLAAGLGYMS